uniref:Uncharacterized protein n=1 Tax=Ditylenchus dipsaci TaxID=166011 RepID=A0A915DZA6_9BILA
MDTSSILSKIRKIRDEDSWTSHVKDYMSNLHNYEVYYDDVMRKIAIEAELRPCCLDSDSDLNEDAYYMVSTAGVFPGDRAVQIIHKDLGGNGCTFNAVPWNAKVMVFEEN